MPRCLALITAFLISVTSLTSTVLSNSDRHESQPPPASINDFETRAFEAVNRERLKLSLRPLQRAEDLSSVARNHSRDMIARQYFAHRSPEGDDLRARFARNGINRWQRIAENIACNLGYRDPVTTAVESWMQSPGHRQNILDQRLTETGIGVAVDSVGRVYFTQVFATRERATIARAK